MGTSQADLLRSLLIALNTRLDLSRDSVCRLALGSDDWALGLGGRSAAELSGRLRVPASALNEALNLRRSAGATAAREIDRATALGAEVVTLVEPGYPAELRDLDLPPPVLYLRGRIPSRPAVAIVGSRRADPYALEAAQMFARRLAGSGLVVVSGLARGADAAAHRGALAAGVGSTLAVQACGIDRTYPPQHARLAEEIVSAGAVLTEFPVGTPPIARNFPVRNRLIAALSIGTLVVQAARRSGTLITARLALELGREVWAIPGSIFARRAVGANELLRDGAQIVLEPRDIIESLPLAIQDRLRPRPTGSESESDSDLTAAGLAGAVLALLCEHSALAPDELALKTSKPVAEVLASLATLELAGRVRRYPGPIFHFVPQGAEDR